MKTNLIRGVMGLVLAMWLCGCGSFWGGMAGGAVGTGAGYEMSARNQMKELNADLKAGRIDQEEYDIRKDQIERGSIVY